MKKIILSILIVLTIVISVIILGNLPKNNNTTPYITINNHQISVLIADTAESRMQGLSNHPMLEDNQGMLFIFPEMVQGSFWMKDMLFALDIIWINNNKVVEISNNILPPAETNNIPQTIMPAVPYTHVLEIAAGWSKTKNIKVNDSVTFNFSN